MTDSVFTWAVVASIGTHVAGLATAAALALAPHDAPRPAPVPIEVVKIEERPAPPPPPPARKVERRQPAPKVTRQVEPTEPAPIQPSKLIDETAALDAPAPKVASSSELPANAMVSPPTPAAGGRREGGPAGAGALFGTGDFAVKPGSGASGGSGGPGRGGTGLASAGASDAAGGAGVTAFARPLGGYQTKPRYPESARTAGIEGVSLLRFVVLADGLVGTVNVEKSAGHPDLDRAAVDAVKTWRFEPARRGKEPVAVWVTIPVRFELTHN